MDEKRVDKTIKQMRGLFGFFGVVTALSAIVFMLFIEEDGLAPVIVQAVLSVCFWTAVITLGKRSHAGRAWATICSIIFLFGFPILTIFGMIYLIKLSRPEMKRAFGTTA
jgi:predicted PurR-regulated permease PerM